MTNPKGLKAALVTLEKKMRILAVVVAIGCWISATPLAHSGDDHDAKLKKASTQSVKAAKVFEEIMQTPDKAIPQDLAPARSVGVRNHWRPHGIQTGHQCRIYNVRHVSLLSCRRPLSVLRFHVGK